MDHKVILVTIDGMRPDGFLTCGHPFVRTLMDTSSYTLNGRTMMPAVTLPCHMSLFLSVPPERHGITTNTYTPLVRPLNGLFEQIKAAGGNSAMYYGWEPLRDVSRPGSLRYAGYLNAYIEDDTDGTLTDMAAARIRRSHPDFVFLYLVETDEKGGHRHGWMSQQYLDCISAAVGCVQRAWEEFGEEYTIVVTSDHGGHGRSHGQDMPEDTMIPMFFLGERFEPGRVLDGITILDIAPTVADVMGIARDPEWEGNSLLE